MAGIHAMQWNRCHIFTNKRGTYGIIADSLRFATQLSNVYGNAIRAKLAAAQTTRSMAGRSQVSRSKTCKASALYTIGIHAFFINLRNPVPLQIHESPPSPRPMPKCYNCSQSKQILRNSFGSFVYYFNPRICSYIFQLQFLIIKILLSDFPSFPSYLREIFYKYLLFPLFFLLLFLLLFLLFSLF